MAVVPATRDEHVPDWIDELRHIVDTAALHSPAAREAICGVLDTFLAEDGDDCKYLDALRVALLRLAAGAAEPPPPESAPVARRRTRLAEQEALGELVVVL